VPIRNAVVARVLAELVKKNCPISDNLFENERNCLFEIWRPVIPGLAEVVVLSGKFRCSGCLLFMPYYDVALLYTVTIKALLFTEQ
jgi:hypothetical protein